MIKSGSNVLCKNCGFKGRAYGTMIGTSVSAPWCPKCGLNNKLVEIPEKVYCTNCGRQVVNYDASNDKYVGSSSARPTRDVNGVICHECIANENAFYNMLEGT